MDLWRTTRKDVWDPHRRTKKPATHANPSRESNQWWQNIFACRSHLVDSAKTFFRSNICQGRQCKHTNYPWLSQSVSHSGPWDFPSLCAVKAMKSESLFSPCSIPPNQWGIKQTLSAASDLFSSSPVAFTEERLLPISIEPQFAIIITAMVMEIGLWRSIGNEPFWVVSWKKEHFPFFNSWPLNSFSFFSFWALFYEAAKATERRNKT